MVGRKMRGRKMEVRGIGNEGEYSIFLPLIFLPVAAILHATAAARP
jgi:hypothetical protein